MSTSRVRFAAIVCFLVVWASGSAAVRAWLVLGQATVRIETSRVRISVPTSKSGVRAVKVQVLRSAAPLRIRSLTVLFPGDRRQVAEIEADVAAGGETRSIDLDAAAPDAVEIDYDLRVVSATSPGVAKLRLVGKP